tara:strand:- start:311 stop:694 length:384 start_codon:yes stop_codon:yes gene_type:complete
MRTIAILLSLTMLACSFAGCLGGDDAGGDASPVGDWYSAEAMIMDINEDGTLIDGEGNSGTWSTDGDILTMAIDESNTYNYAVEDGWLWIKMVDDDDCYPLQSESMTDEEREASLSEQTPPSFCPED